MTAKDTNITLSICFPTYNRLQFLRFVIQNIINSPASKSISYEIIVGYTESGDGTKDYLKSVKEVKAYEIGNLNNNKAYLHTFRKANGKYVLALNDHIFLKMKSVVKMIRDMELNNDIDCLMIADASGGKDAPSRRPFERPSYEHISGLALGHLRFFKREFVSIFDENYCRNFYDHDFVLNILSRGGTIGFYKYVTGMELKFDNGLSPSDIKGDFLYQNRNNDKSNLSDAKYFYEKHSEIINLIKDNDESGFLNYLCRMMLKMLNIIYRNKYIPVWGDRNKFTIYFEDLVGIEKLKNYDYRHFSFKKNNNAFLYRIYLFILQNMYRNSLIKKIKKENFFLVQKLDIKK